jgi:hypothetical protein
MRIEIAEETIPGAQDEKAITIPMTNGDTLRLHREDPYGFWFMSLKSGGGVPHPFNGAYTDKPAIELAAKKYLDSRRIQEGESTRPELKLKPGYGPDGKKLKE